jgi:ADP-heptose:LPS heptosyltransferase
MYRDNHIFNPNHIPYNFNFSGSGVGDVIARLPVVKYCLDNHPQINIHLWVGDYFVDVAKKALPKYKNLTIRGISEGYKKYKDSFYARSPDHRESITNLAMHMTDHAFYTVGHCAVENEYKNYIKIDPIDISNFNLPEKYIIVTTGYTSPVRHWLPESIDGVVNYIIEKGYTPVFLGKGETKTSEDPQGNKKIIKGNFTADYSKGINLIDKTNLLEAHAIMQSSKCVVGLDNGLLHLAAMGNVPIVFGFTTVKPMHRLPYRYGQIGWKCYPVVPPQSLKCRFCQSNMIFGLNHNFTNCFYGNDDISCTKLLKSELFIEELKKNI